MNVYILNRLYAQSGNVGMIGIFSSVEKAKAAYPKVEWKCEPTKDWEGREVKAWFAETPEMMCGIFEVEVNRFDSENVDA